MRIMGVGPYAAAGPPPSHPPIVHEQPHTADVDQEPGEEPEQAAPARALNDRLVDWWRTDKPHLADDALKPDDEGDEGDEQDELLGPDAEDDEEPEPAPKAKGRGPRRGPRRVAKTDEQDEDEDEDEDEEEAGERVPAAPRWSRPALGRPPGLPPKRQNLVTWWRNDVESHSKWLIYHGTGLGAGLYYGVPKWGLLGAEFVTTHDGDDISVWATWGLLGIVVAVDRRARNLALPLAWAARGITTSLVIGAIWHGTPLSDISH
jgi:hypothetical protein